MEHCDLKYEGIFIRFGRLLALIITDILILNVRTFILFQSVDSTLVGIEYHE